MAAHCDSDQSIKLSVTTCSDQSVVRSPRHPSIETRVCLVSTACQNEALIQALKSIDVPFLTSSDGSEYASCEDPRYETVFVLEEFEGEIFNRLKQHDCRILGSPVVMHVASTNEPLPYTYRPQYCSCMQGLILCFSNFKTKEHLTRLVTLCHYMGACVRKDMSAKVTFLVTNLLHGPKYRTAVSLGIPVVKEDWVHMCWAARRRCGVHGTDDEFVLPCKSKPFEGCTLSFLGFSEKESKHMQEQAIQQGAKVAEVGDASCSHLVVEEDNVKSLPFQPQERLFVVIQEWFWGSIQIEARAAESMYYFEIAEQRPMMTRSSTTSSLLGTPQKWRDTNGQSGVSRTSSSKYSFCRKRSRLREETLAKLSQDSEHDTAKQPPTKRPSTDTSTCISESLLDISNNAAAVRSPRGQDLFKGQRVCAKKANPLSKKRFELSVIEARSPRRGTPVRMKGKEGRQRCSGQTGGRKPVAESNSTKADLRRNSCLVRKRKSAEFDKDLSLAVVANKDGSVRGDVALEVEGPSDVEGSTAKKRRRVRQRRRLSLGPLQLSDQARRFFRRLSSSSLYQESLSPVHDEPSTILEENESRALFEDTLREAEKSASPVLYGRISQVDDFREDSADEDPQNGKKAVSARYQVAMEFLQTETNYVGILSTILNVFKQPLEDPKQAGGPILPSENIKAIFGSLPEIHSVHTRMAADLSKVMSSWVESSCIGCIVKKYAAEFVRCYPPFVNFFEMAKETISSCEASLPRFHAFLKINQAKKECGRQTLAELLINPVQRLPRIILLLQDIKKHTERENESHPDVAGIQSALDAVKEVMTHINEDKRKTESQKQIFDIVYEVDGCPPTIVSSHREFITRAELISVDDNLSSKGDHICLFLFSDCVELAKRKRGIKSHSFKSPNVHARPTGAVRCLKHIKLISLSHIKKVVNIKNSEDCQSAFSLFCRTPTDTQDWLYTFKMLSCTSDCGQNDSEKKDQQSNATLTHDDGKTRLLQLLSRHRANTVCKASDDNFVHTVASHELDISTSDVGSTIGRAVRAAKKSHKKLTRVFSFSRTPRHAVQRAVSNMMSPASRAALPTSEHITPGLGTTPSRAAQATSRLYGSQFSVNSYDMDDQDCGASSSGLTPSMSVSNICTPQRDRRGNRLSSTASLKVLSHTYVINPLTYENNPDDSFDGSETSKNGDALLNESQC